MIGIIGFGRFGKLTARYLAEDFDVFVFNRRDKSAQIKKIGANTASLSTVCQQNIVILCVPISTLKEILIEIGPILKNDVLVVDVCSVKEYPSRWMKDLLPETVSILATHPMFGPDSASDSLKGKKIFLSQVRVKNKRYQKIKSYLSSKGLIIIESTPEDHDEQIAISLALTHLIGRTLSEFGAAELNMDTEGYKRLLNILDVVEHDTWQLFHDMHQYNPYAKKKRIAFMKAMKKISDRLEQ
ncbi:MAG: prephenate dehydrogenase/arogenate dehydrogenase family protein [Desulfobacterales bacterium]|nr:MAG: prephenate dehydrogenase/arogenate dehydrogenase family protein [Desulfobacterales bacterium]